MNFWETAAGHVLGNLWFMRVKEHYKKTLQHFYKFNTFASGDLKKKLESLSNQGERIVQVVPMGGDTYLIIAETKE